LEQWHVSARHLAKLMGPGATELDAQDMADLLSEKGYLTFIGTEHLPHRDVSPVPQTVWDDCLMTLAALRTF